MLGVAGACRREELYNMAVEDIEDRGEFIFVKIPDTKTHIQRSFTITNIERKRDNSLSGNFSQIFQTTAKSCQVFSLIPELSSWKMYYSSGRKAYDWQMALKNCRVFEIAKSSQLHGSRISAHICYTFSE